MKLLTTLESKLGLTRPDVTVALFTVLTAFVGFLYTHFFDNREEQRQVQEAGMVLLSQRSVENMTAGKQGEASDNSTSSIEYDDGKPEQTDHGSNAQVVPGAIAGGSHGGLKGSIKHVNINIAMHAELMTLPGVGEVMAERIIAYRLSKPFERPEDIIKVRGIGPKTFERLKEYVVVD